MAVTTALEKKSLILQLDGGLDDGKQKVYSRTFSNINEASTDQALHDTASIIADLQEHDLLKVLKRENSAIFSV